MLDCLQESRLWLHGNHAKRKACSHSEDSNTNTWPISYVSLLWRTTVLLQIFSCWVEKLLSSWVNIFGRYRKWPRHDAPPLISFIPRHRNVLIVFCSGFESRETKETAAHELKHSLHVCTVSHNDGIVSVQPVSHVHIVDLVDFFKSHFGGALTPHIT